MGISGYLELSNRKNVRDAEVELSKMPKAAEWPITCGRCGHEWDWLSYQITRCPKCALPLDVNAIKSHFAEKKDALTITPESLEAFQRDMQGEVGKLFPRRRS